MQSGGHGHAPTWSEVLGVGGFDPGAASRGAYRGLVHGIASHPKPPPAPKARAAPAVQQQQQPYNPRDAFLKALRAIQPTVDMRGMVCLLCSSADLA